MSARAGWRIFLALLQRDWLLLWRRRSEFLQPLAFAAIVTTLFPLALGPQIRTLSGLACGIVLVIVILANLLTLEHLFKSDVEDGSLDVMLASGQPMMVLVGAKIAGHWLGTGAPLVVCAPWFAALLGMPVASVPFMMLVLALVTLLLSLVGACGAALTAAMPRAGMVLAALVLPLTVPVLIFGAGALQAWQLGLDAASPLLFLAAGIALGLPIAPWVCVKALQIQNG